MRVLRWFVVVALAALLIGIFLVRDWNLAYPNGCIDGRAQKQEITEYSPYDKCPTDRSFVFSKMQPFFAWVVHVAHGYDKEIIALATVVIAILTIGLVGSTIGLWIATARTARIAQRTLTDLERPYLFILDYNWVLIDPDKAGGRKSGLVYSVANGGKLPAFIKSVKFGIKIGGSTIPDMEDVPEIHDLLTAPLIGGGDKREVSQGFTDENGGGALECEIRGGLALIPGSVLKAGRVITKISIEYDGPITFGHETTACWEWHRIKHAFTQYGGPEHNRRT